MKVLFFGDVYGRPGREMVKKHLIDLKAEYDVDLTLLNCENIAHGRGVTKKIIEDMMEVGVDGFTSGDHIWDNTDGVQLLKNFDTVPLIRPLNYPEGVPGSGYMKFETDAGTLLVVNLLGRTFIKAVTDCPFRGLEVLLQSGDVGPYDAVFVDFHAEATSEKIAMKWHFDGRISALVGTHTHVPTADAEITRNGTAYITDVGFTGPHESCIGVKNDIIISRFLTQLPMAHEPETEGVMELNAVVIEIGVDGRARNIETVRVLE
jgi:2',3'-cyclic-nucleotide 2'-phosphodiesterase